MDRQARYGQKLILVMVSTCSGLSLAYSLLDSVWHPWLAKFAGIVILFTLGIVFGFDSFRAVLATILLIVGVYVCGSFLEEVVDFELLNKKNLLLPLAVAFICFAMVLFFSESIGDYLAVRRFPKGMHTPWESLNASRSSTIFQTITQPHEIRQQAARIARAGRKAFTAVTVSYGLLAVVALGTILWVGFDINRSARQAKERMYRRIESTPGVVNKFFATVFEHIGYGIVRGIDAIFFVILVAFVYFCLFLLPGLISLPFTLPLALRWKHPAKFLLLRPFNHNWVSSQLQTVVRKEISPFGHVYTLSDADIQIPWFVRMPLLLGQLSFFSFRMRKVRKPEDVLQLVQYMSRRRLRNLNWCVSINKIFSVTCGDSGWRTVVTRLITEVDAVLLDLSAVGEGIAWELTHLRNSGALRRTVLLAAGKGRDKAEETIQHLGGQDGVQATLFIYRDEGLEKSAAFRANLATILARADSTEHELEMSPRFAPRDRIVSTTVRNLLIVLIELALLAATIWVLFGW